MDDKYPLTLDHVRQFLATKRDDEELGYCGNAMHCLLSNTLDWLYPQQIPWRVDLGAYMSMRVPDTLRLTHPLDFLRTAFDYSRQNFGEIVTKRQLREYLEWLSTQQDHVTPSAKMPFTVEDLFGGREQ